METALYQQGVSAYSPQAGNDRGTGNGAREQRRLIYRKLRVYLSVNKWVEDIYPDPDCESIAGR